MAYNCTISLYESVNKLITNIHTFCLFCRWLYVFLNSNCFLPLILKKITELLAAYFCHFSNTCIGSFHWLILSIWLIPLLNISTVSSPRLFFHQLWIWGSLKAFSGETDNKSERDREGKRAQKCNTHPCLDTTSKKRKSTLHFLNI